MLTIRLKQFFACFALFLGNNTAAQEYIQSYTSDISIQKTGALLVHETIQVIVTNNIIKHGIVRSFPLYYKNFGTIQYMVHFAIESIRFDGEITAYHTKHTATGIDIYIGDPSVHVSPGRHVYAIIYKTNRQLGFFKDYDELYWNVTGTDWSFPIKKVSAHVHFESTQPPYSTITTEAYTGPLGSQGSDYTVSIKPSEILYETTNTLAINEGITIVLTWPKGYVQEPSWYMKVYWFFDDNLVIAWSLLCLLILCLWYTFALIRIRRQDKSRTVIPLFYPPDNVTPSGIGFIDQKYFDENLVTPDIIMLATKGYLTINQDQQSGAYSLSATLYPNDNANPLPEKYDAKLLETLFAQQQTIILNRTYAKTVTQLMTVVKNQCIKNYDYHILHNSSVIIIGALISVIGYIPLLLWYSESLFLIIEFILQFINILMVKAVKTYTPDGKKIHNEIEGFKLFLKTTAVSIAKCNTL